DIDHRADIYGLGAMLFEMLTGELPFQASSRVKVMSMHIMQPVPLAQPLRPELPGEVDDVLQKAMAKDRDARYATAVELAEALTEALGGSVTSSTAWLREAAGTSLMMRVGGADSRTDAQTTPSERHKQVTALYANAAEYAEIVEDKSGSEAARLAIN